LSLSWIYHQKSFDYNYSGGTICRITENIISDVSKSAWCTSNYKELAGYEICQGTGMLYYQTKLSRNRLNVGFSVKVPQKFDVIRNLSRYGARPIKTAPSIFTNGPAIWGGCVTRRSIRQGPGTLARKLSRCKEGMARVFAVQVQILLSITRVAVQV
jgi:hypothetical protein